MGESEVAIEERLRPYVQHAIDGLLRPVELDEWWFEWSTDAGDRRAQAIVVARGEWYRGFVWHDQQDSPEAALNVYVDGLEDFVSESGFAWGEQRILTDRPWSR